MALVDSQGNTLSRPLTKVVICVPTRGECKSGFAYDLARLVYATQAARSDVRLAFQFGTGTLMHDLRNSLVRDALKFDPDYLFWLDDDIRFPNHALLRLLACDRDIVGTNYPKRILPTSPTAMMRDANGLDYWPIPSPFGAEGIEEVDVAGFGCMLTRASLFAKIPKPWFSMPYEPRQDMHVGEDVYFCVNAKAAGYQTHIEHGLSRELRHVGSFDFAWEHYDAQVLENEVAQAAAEGAEAAPE